MVIVICFATEKLKCVKKKKNRKREKHNNTISVEKWGKTNNNNIAIAITYYSTRFLMVMVTFITNKKEKKKKTLKRINNVRNDERIKTSSHVTTDWSRLVPASYLLHRHSIHTYRFIFSKPRNGSVYGRA